MNEQPAWGTPAQQRYYPPEKGAPPVPQVHVQPGSSLDLLALHRRATTALIVNAVLAIFFLGLLCIPGAALAALSLGEKHDPERARRLLRWSWGFLAANLLFYVLLMVSILLIGVFLFLAATN
jgi:hypothetical protein